ncbi:MAG: hypothetical protein LQ351_002175 [Letrouitia transgressa]|nr:MAG: hypothetical protein LQ351_002175 [Letrouitia transgressa]
MVSQTTNDNADEPPADDEGLFDPSEAAEIVPDDPDHPMDSGDDEDPAADHVEIQLENNSIAHFDLHKDSIFCIAQHPLKPTIIATGSGDDSTFTFSTADASSALPPLSNESRTPTTSSARTSLPPIAKLTGHTDSVSALTFTLPDGEFLVTGGLDGRVRAHSVNSTSYALLGETQEVQEINFLLPCPHPSYPNTIALGDSNGSVWVYTVDGTDKETPLQVLQAYYLHTESCTAGAWTPDGKMLATVSEDGSFYVWDVFGEAAEMGLGSTSQGQALVGLTAKDSRFAVEGGLFSVAVAPSGAFAAAGGADGTIRIVGLPRPAAIGTTDPTDKVQKGGRAKDQDRGARKAGSARQGSAAQSSAGQAGHILASLQAQSDVVESLAFSNHNPLLAAGSVDGSIVLFDTAHQFTVRRIIREAHEGFAVVQVEFVDTKASDGAWLLTSCGLDGVVRRWDTRGGSIASATATVASSIAGGGGGQQGLVRELKGHTGNGEGVLGFVQSGGERIITAGDDGVCLIFEAGL